MIMGERRIRRSPVAGFGKFGAWRAYDNSHGDTKFDRHQEILSIDDEKHPLTNTQDKRLSQ